jgi:microcystin-dependent protein
MADPFIGEIRMFGFNYAPRNWMQCNGAVIAISQNTALFAILGTQFGGDGRTNFGIPNLQGRAAIGAGTGPGLTPQSVGQTGGTPTVMLTTSELPAHNHVLNAGQLNPPNANQNVAIPTSAARLGRSSPNNTYTAPTTPNTQMIASSISSTGGGAGHENMQPYLAMNYCIAVAGIFPSRN